MMNMPTMKDRPHKSETSLRGIDSLASGKAFRGNLLTMKDHQP
jgi:hypothetical protein